MRKNPHDRILKMEYKEQHLSAVLKSCSFIKIDPRRYFQTLIKIYLSTKKDAHLSLHLMILSTSSIY